MAATGSGHALWVPPSLQNVAYANKLLIQSPNNGIIGKPLSRVVFIYFSSGVYSGGAAILYSIFSRHQQVIPGHKYAATVDETDGWIRHGERGEEGGREGK